jgi:hypothetical protein
MPADRHRALRGRARAAPLHRDPRLPQEQIERREPRAQIAERDATERRFIHRAEPHAAMDSAGRQPGVAQPGPAGDESQRQQQQQRCGEHRTEQDGGAGLQAEFHAHCSAL